MIALVATMGNTDDWQEVEMFGRLHQDWFAKFLELPNGIPSHDTFERVFARLAPAQMNACFERWITSDRRKHCCGLVSGWDWID